MAAPTTTPPQKEVVAPTTEKKSDRIEKPEKPDEEAHKAQVAKLEAEHKAIMEKFVSSYHHLHFCAGGYRLIPHRTLSAQSSTPPSPTRMDH